MSRIGKLPIIVPAQVTVTISGRVVQVKGPKGELKHTLPGQIQAKVEDGKLLVTCPDMVNEKNLYGLTRTILSNLVHGVTEGFSKKVEIQGVGYKSSLKGKTLVLNLGYSHPIEFVPPAGIEIAINEKENSITFTGIDKQLVGAVAAKVRSYRKPEPYKGKGIRYSGEYVPRKEGKKAATAE